MRRQVISTPDAPASPLYSQAIKVGDVVYVAGTPAADPVTGEYATTIVEQTRQALLNCRAILRAAGAELADVVDVHQLLLDPEDADGVNEVWPEFFPSDPPARSVGKIGVRRPGILISFKMTAVVGCGRPR